MESRTGRKKDSGLHRRSLTSSGEVLDITRPKSPPSSNVDDSVTKPLCVNPGFLRVDRAREVEPLALPEVAS